MKNKTQKSSTEKIEEIMACVHDAVDHLKELQELSQHAYPKEGESMVKTLALARRLPGATANSVGELRRILQRVKELTPKAPPV